VTWRLSTLRLRLLLFRFSSAPSLLPSFPPPHLPSFPPSLPAAGQQVIGNLAWAYAALGARHQLLVAALASSTAAAATALNAQELSNVLYGMARLMPYMADTQPEALDVSCGRG
jgi:hypothetical protein